MNKPDQDKRTASKRPHKAAARGIPLPHMAKRRKRSQAYYWTPEWQAGERESREDIARGDAVTFATADEAVSWLLS